MNSANSIKATIIFNYNSYFTRLIPSTATVRTLYKTLPFYVNRKPEDILYVIIQGKLLGADYNDLELTLNKLGLINNECNIHLIFKVNSFTYSYNELLPSFNALGATVQSQSQTQTQNQTGQNQMPVTIDQFLERLQPENITLTEEQISVVTRDSIGTGEENCSVCQDGMLLDLLELPCGHKFHRQCIRNWLLNFSILCPMCSADSRQTM
jgi:hypothetical protein